MSNDDGPLHGPQPRTVPDGWIELPPTFTLEVEHGLHPGWTYLNAPGIGGEAIVYTPPDARQEPPKAWSIRRDRILGQPMPVDQTVVEPPSEHPRDTPPTTTM